VSVPRLSIGATARAILHRIFNNDYFQSGEYEMNQIKIVAAILMMAGVLALVYGGFTYTKSTQQAKIGPLELTVQDKETVNVPVWAGVGAIVIGGLLLLAPGKKG